MVNFADNPTIEEEYLALASLIMMAEHVDFDVPFKVVNDATKKTFNRISRNQNVTALQDEPVKFEDLKYLELGHHKCLSFWNLNTDQRKVS